MLKFDAVKFDDCLKRVVIKKPTLLKGVRKPTLAERLT